MWDKYRIIGMGLFVFVWIVIMVFFLLILTSKLHAYELIEPQPSAAIASSEKLRFKVFADQNKAEAFAKIDKACWVSPNYQEHTWYVYCQPANGVYFEMVEE